MQKEMITFLILVSLLNVVSIGAWSNSGWRLSGLGGGGKGYYSGLYSNNGWGGRNGYYNGWNSAYPAAAWAYNNNNGGWNYDNKPCPHYQETPHHSKKGDKDEEDEKAHGWESYPSESSGYLKGYGGGGYGGSYGGYGSESSSRSNIDKYLKKLHKLGNRRLSVEVDYNNTPLEYLYLQQYHGVQHPLAGTALGQRYGIGPLSPSTMVQEGFNGAGTSRTSFTGSSGGQIPYDQNFRSSIQPQNILGQTRNSVSQISPPATRGFYPSTVSAFQTRTSSLPNTATQGSFMQKPLNSFVQSRNFQPAVTSPVQSFTTSAPQVQQTAQSGALPIPNSYQHSLFVQTPQSTLNRQNPFALGEAFIGGQTGLSSNTPDQYTQNLQAQGRTSLGETDNQGFSSNMVQGGGVQPSNEHLISPVPTNPSEFLYAQPDFFNRPTTRAFISDAQRQFLPTAATGYQQPTVVPSVLDSPSSDDATSDSFSTSSSQEDNSFLRPL